MSLANIFSVCLMEAFDVVPCGVPLVGGSGGVIEGVILEHPGADAFGELPRLFFDVGQEGIRVPAAYQHDCVDLIHGQVHHHCKGGSD